MADVKNMLPCQTDLPDPFQFNTCSRVVDVLVLLSRLILMLWGHGGTTGQQLGVHGRVMAALTYAVSPTASGNCPTMWPGRRASGRQPGYLTLLYPLTLHWRLAGSWVKVTMNSSAHHSDFVCRWPPHQFGKTGCNEKEILRGALLGRASASAGNICGQSVVASSAALLYRHHCCLQRHLLREICCV